MSTLIPPQPPAQPQPPASAPRRLSTLSKILLFAGIPILVIALLAGVAVSTAGFFNRGSAAHAQADASTAEAIGVYTPNAALDFSPSTDGRVHVTMTGRYTGTAPTLDLTTTNGETRITGGCPDGWIFFNRCAVTLHIEVPGDVPLTVRGENGRISADGLTGDLDFSTENGRIETSGTAGEVLLKTTNGSVSVLDSESARVDAGTTNGSIELELATAPERTVTSTVNGGISIRVPDDGTDYAVTADTTNGNISTDAVRTVPGSGHSISAQTVNGGVTIERADR